MATDKVMIHPSPDDDISWPIFFIITSGMPIGMMMVLYGAHYLKLNTGFFKEVEVHGGISFSQN